MKYLIDESIDKLLKENPEILTLRISSLMEIVQDYHSYKKTKYYSDRVGATNIQDIIKSLRINNELLATEDDRFFRESYGKLFGYNYL